MKKLFILLIFLIPISVNLIYKLAVSNYYIFSIDLKDIASYLISVKYQYPDIPPNKIIDLNQLMLHDGLCPVKDCSEKVVYSSLDLDQIPEEKRKLLFSQDYYLINFSSKSCTSVTKQVFSDLETKIYGNSSNPFGNPERFPGYSLNNFLVKIGHDDIEVHNFVLDRCNINQIQGLQIEFNNTTKIYD